MIRYTYFHFFISNMKKEKKDRKAKSVYAVLCCPIWCHSIGKTNKESNHPLFRFPISNFGKYYKAPQITEEQPSWLRCRPPHLDALSVILNCQKCLFPDLCLVFTVFSGVFLRWQPLAAPAKQFTTSPHVSLQKKENTIVKYMKLITGPNLYDQNC